MTDQGSARQVLEALARTAVGQRGVLVGSSGLFGFETAVPALTEDIDIAVPKDLVEAHGAAIVEALRAQGFEHEAGTATFSNAAGLTFDLLGHGAPGSPDEIASGGPLCVMVFSDLSLILGMSGTVHPLPAGKALTPAAFVATKLLTERSRKGAKDKLQALLVLAEREASPELAPELELLLRAVAPVRRDDVRAAAQEALLSLGADPLFKDAGAEQYASLLESARAGFKALGGILERIDA